MNQVEEIKSKLDIVEVVGSYLALNQVAGNYKALCPFHNEKTPSFMVSREKQIWHCFGCDRGGDMLTFVMEHEGLDFISALRVLAEKAGITLQNTTVKKQDNSKLYEINQSAAQYYITKLRDGAEVSKKVLAYLEKRKVIGQSIDKWQLGLSGDAWDELYQYLKNKTFLEKDIFDAGLIVRKKDGSGFVDRFRRRLMFPITDHQGRVVAFTSRTLQGIAYDEEDLGGKYINSPQTLIYDKSQILYGWHFAKNFIRQQKYLIIVEGNMDALMAHQVGTQNTVAVSGTALTSAHLKLIKRYCSNLILAFDGDAAGSRAVFRSVALAWKEDMNLKVLVLPKAQDPADMIKEDSTNWFSAVKNAEPIMDYYVRRVLSSIDLNRSDHKKLAVRKLLPMIKYLESKVEQAHYLKIVSDRLQLPLTVLEEDMAKTTAILQEEPKLVAPVVEKQSQKDQLYSLSEGLLAIAFHRTVYLEKMIAEIEPDSISDSLQSLYRNVIIHYTKHQNLTYFLDAPDITEKEKELYSRLSLLVDQTQAEQTEIGLEKDFIAILKRFKVVQISRQKEQLISQLKTAELNKQMDEQEQLIHKINLLNKELQKLQN